MLGLLLKGCQFANDLIGTDEKPVEKQSTVVVDCRAFPASRGEVVTVIKSGYTQSYIEVVSTGMRGYVESEFVRSKMEE